jgi:hypothetical protein
VVAKKWVASPIPKKWVASPIPPILQKIGKLPYDNPLFSPRLFTRPKGVLRVSQNEEFVKVY